MFWYVSGTPNPDFQYSLLRSEQSPNGFYMNSSYIYRERRHDCLLSRHLLSFFLSLLAVFYIVAEVPSFTTEDPIISISAQWKYNTDFIMKCLDQGPGDGDCQLPWPRHINAEMFVIPSCADELTVMAMFYFLSCWLPVNTTCQLSTLSIFSSYETWATLYIFIKPTDFSCVENLASYQF